MIRIEYRYPWNRRWTGFGVTTRRDLAQELLEVCRQSRPGSECRIRVEEAATRVFMNAV